MMMRRLLFLIGLFCGLAECYRPMVRTTHRRLSISTSLSLFDPERVSSSSAGAMGGVTGNKEDDESTTGRTYASYVVYKTKAAVSVKVFPASFEMANKARVVSREGGLFLEFANSSGPRTYDWTKKGTFLVSTTECGELLMLDSSSKGLEFFHDPNMGTQSAGQITKKIKLAPAPDGKGLFLSLAVNDKSIGSSAYSVPISWGELQVIKSIVQYSIPYFLGLAQAIQSGGAMMSNEESSDVGNGNGSNSNYMAPPPPPPPPPLYKDFWGNKEQYQVKSQP